MRVIEGGVRPDEPAPVVWNRMPGKARALVIRRDGARVVLALDDGRKTLAGICETWPGLTGETRINAWRTWAAGEGVEVRDERPLTETVILADGPVEQGLLFRVDANSTAQAIALEQQRRQAKRRADAPPSGGLFDEGARNEQSLFG